MGVALLFEGIYQLLYFSLTGFVLALNLLFVFWFKELKISFGKFDADQLFYLVHFRLTVLFAQPVFPQGMIKASGSMPCAALRIGERR